MIAFRLYCRCCMIEQWLVDGIGRLPNSGENSVLQNIMHVYMKHCNIELRLSLTDVLLLIC